MKLLLGYLLVLFIYASQEVHVQMNVFCQILISDKVHLRFVKRFLHGIHSLFPLKLVKETS